MLSDQPAILFVACSDKERARPFYEETLGLKFIRDDEFAFVFEVGGRMLRLTQAAQFQPQPFTVLGWEVEDVKKTLHELTARGVVFEKYPFSDADGIWTIGTDKVAWFKDTEGNVLSIASHG